MDQPDARLAQHFAALDDRCSGRLGICAAVLDPQPDELRLGPPGPGNERGHRVAPGPGAPNAVRWRAEETFRTASTIKAFIHLVVLSELGPELSQRVKLAHTDLTGGSGVLTVLQPGLAPTLADLCTLMIVISDNTATNLLLDRLGGFEQANALIAAAGFQEARLHRRLEYPPPPLVAGVKASASLPTMPFGTATPSALWRLVARACRGQAVSAQVSEQLLLTLAHQQSQSGVPRAFLELAPPGLPPGPWPSIANKTGAVPGCRAELGVIGLPGGRRIAYGVMADELADRSMSVLSEGDELLGEVGAALLAHWWDGDGPPPLRPGWPHSFE